jgi:hypothetical protein
MMIMTAWTQPPTDMVIPPTAQLVATISLGTVTGAMLIAALVHWARTREPLYVIGILGGLLAAVNEPLADVIGMCFHPLHGQWTVFTAFDRPIPVWAVLCYPVYFGGLSCLMVSWLRAGITRRRFWTGVGVVMLGNALFEFPILAADVYVYYGEQPFRVFGMPLVFFVINALGAVLGALVVAHLWPALKGAAKLLVVLVPWVTQVAAYGIAAPHLFTLNSDLPLGVKYLGTALAIGFGLLVLDQLSRYAAHRFPAATIGALNVCDGPGAPRSTVDMLTRRTTSPR